MVITALTATLTWTDWRKFGELLSTDSRVYDGNQSTLTH